MGLFVVMYKGVEDPPPAEEKALLLALDGLRVVDRWPGTVVVEARQEDLERRLRSLFTWSFSPAQSVEL